MGDENQNEYSNNLNASIDIEELYINVIKNIEKYRSYVNIVNNRGLLQQLINGLKADNISPDSFITQIKPEPTPQESRCHTFYRLIGLPVIAPDGKSMYSPGFDVDNSYKKDITKKHYEVILSIQNNKPGLFNLMDARENNANSFLKIFSLSNLKTKIADINASVLLLSSVSGGKNYFTMRRFSSPLENSSDPFDSDINNQSYTITNEEPKNSTNSTNLTSYKDSNGKLATSLFSRNESGQLTNPGKQFILKESPLIRRAHILKPFIVDPRVDLTINPPKGIILAPFMFDGSKAQYNDGTTLNRPFIELVCQKRFNKDNQQINNKNDLPERYKDWVSYIKNTDQSLDQDILEKINKGVNQTIEVDILLSNLDIIRSMINELFESLAIIQDVEKTYHWIPIPDHNGPEIAVGTQDIKLLSNEGIASLDPLITPVEKEILTLTAKIELSNINSSNVKADLGNFALQNIQAIPDGTITAGFNSRNKKSLDELNEKRIEATNNAAKAIRIVEIIMGEFSGLGLCDIIAIFTALWTIDKKILVNMLDQESFDRMYQIPSLRDDVVEARKSANEPTMNGIDVLTGFETKIKEIYALMDKILEARFGS